MKKHPNLRHIEKAVRFLDSKFKIPGTPFRFGLDPVIGLIPFAGDIITLLIQGMLATEMLRCGASGRVAARMFINILMDTLLGSVPVAGALIDIFFKANTRNLKLLKEHYEEGKHKGSATKVIVLFISAIAGLLLIVTIGFVMLIRWIYLLISG